MLLPTSTETPGELFSISFLHFLPYLIASYLSRRGIGFGNGASYAYGIGDADAGATTELSDGAVQASGDAYGLGLIKVGTSAGGSPKYSHFWLQFSSDSFV